MYGPRHDVVYVIITRQQEFVYVCVWGEEERGGCCQRVVMIVVAIMILTVVDWLK